MVPLQKGLQAGKRQGPCLHPYLLLRQPVGSPLVTDRAKPPPGTPEVEVPLHQPERKTGVLQEDGQQCQRPHHQYVPCITGRRRYLIIHQTSDVPRWIWKILISTALCQLWGGFWFPAQHLSAPAGPGEARATARCKPGLSSFLSYASNVCGYSCELSVISDLVLKDLSFQGGQIITEW